MLDNVAVVVHRATTRNIRGADPPRFVLRIALESAAKLTYVQLTIDAYTTDDLTEPLKVSRDRACRRPPF
jgi:hypothetical protein